MIDATSGEEKYQPIIYLFREIVYNFSTLSSTYLKGEYVKVNTLNMSNEE